MTLFRSFARPVRGRKSQCRLIGHPTVLDPEQPPQPPSIAGRSADRQNQENPSLNCRARVDTPPTRAFRIWAAWSCEPAKIATEAPHPVAKRP